MLRLSPQTARSYATIAARALSHSVLQHRPYPSLSPLRDTVLYSQSVSYISMCMDIKVFGVLLLDLTKLYGKLPRLGYRERPHRLHCCNQFRFGSIAVCSTAPSSEACDFPPPKGSPSRVALRSGWCHRSETIHNGVTDVNRSIIGSVETSWHRCQAPPPLEISPLFEEDGPRVDGYQKYMKAHESSSRDSCQGPTTWIGSSRA